MFNPQEAMPAAAPPPNGSGPDGVALLKQVIELMGEYKAGEQDEEDVLVAEQITSLAQKLLAKNQRQLDGLLQGKMDPASLRRAFG